MKRIPDRNILTGLHGVSPEYPDKNRSNISSKSGWVRPTSNRTYVILIALFLIMAFIVIPLIEYNNEKQKEEAHLQYYARRREVLSSYEFDFPGPLYYVSDTEEIYIDSITYDIAYYGEGTNSIEFTITGKAYPKATKTSTDYGVYLVIFYYDSEGKPIDGGYLNDGMLMAGETFEFTHTIFDLEPGVYSVKVFSQNDGNRPTFIPER